MTTSICHVTIRVGSNLFPGRGVADFFRVRAVSSPSAPDFLLRHVAKASFGRVGDSWRWKRSDRYNIRFVRSWNFFRTCTRHWRWSAPSLVWSPRKRLRRCGDWPWGVQVGLGARFVDTTLSRDDRQEGGLDIRRHSLRVAADIDIGRPRATRTALLRARACASERTLCVPGRVKMPCRDVRARRSILNSLSSDVLTVNPFARATSANRAATPSAFPVCDPNSTLTVVVVDVSALSIEVLTTGSLRTCDSIVCFSFPHGRPPSPDSSACCKVEASPRPRLQLNS